MISGAAMPAAQHAPTLAGLSVLIVEDELLVAMDYEELLRHEGCTVLGPAGRRARALALLEHARPDAAILDLNLAGERSTPVAEALEALAVPFVIVTGYGDRMLHEPALLRAPRLEKPVKPQELVRIIGLIARRG
jgi:DNA-binding response OmpR family regulator